jgi:hypothetical protein
MKNQQSLLDRRLFRYQGGMDDDKDESGTASRPPGTAASQGAKGASGAASEAERRRARAAAKLKENLARRKRQLRARRSGQADETEGLPAAKMDESS